MQTENLFPTTYDAQLDILNRKIEKASEQLLKLKRKQAVLRFTTICQILNIQMNALVLFTFPNGRKEVMRLTGTETDGDAVFSMVVSRPYTLGQHCIRLDSLQQGIYDGVNSVAITKIEQEPA